MASLQLTSDPIPQLIRKIAIPTSVGFLFNTLYNVVDTFYGKFLHTEGLAALSLSFPIFFIIIALGSGISTGATALIANHLGAKDHREAGYTLAQAVTFSLLISALLILLGGLTIPPLLTQLSGSETVQRYATEYLLVILAGVPFFLLQAIFNAGLTSRGDTVSYRNVLIVGFLLNLLLDPLLLFGYEPLGIPSMGAAGIALATVLIQVFGTIYLALKAKREGAFEGVGVKALLPIVSKIKAIAQQGFPASLSMMTVALGILIINYFLELFGATTALAAYGIAVRIEQIALLPTIGLTTAILTISGQNFGAGKIERVRETYLTALKYGVYIMVVMLGIIIPLAPFLLSLFTKEKEVIAIGKEYLYIEIITFYSYVLLFSTTSLLQGLKRPNFAMIIGAFRQFLLPIPIFWLFGKLFGWGVSGIWWGIAIITWGAALIAFWYGKKVLHGLESKKATPS